MGQLLCFDQFEGRGFGAQVLRKVVGMILKRNASFQIAWATKFVMPGSNPQSDLVLKCHGVRSRSRGSCIQRQSLPRFAGFPVFISAQSTTSASTLTLADCFLWVEGLRLSTPPAKVTTTPGGCRAAVQVEISKSGAQDTCLFLFSFIC